MTEYIEWIGKNAPEGVKVDTKNIQVLKTFDGLWFERRSMSTFYPDLNYRIKKEDIPKSEKSKEPQIPEGYYLLSTGDTVCKGDYISGLKTAADLAKSDFSDLNEWSKCIASVGANVCNAYWYIRKIPDTVKTNNLIPDPPDEHTMTTCKNNQSNESDQYFVFNGSEKPNWLLSDYLSEVQMKYWAKEQWSESGKTFSKKYDNDICENTFNNNLDSIFRIPKSFIPKQFQIPEKGKTMLLSLLSFKSVRSGLHWWFVDPAKNIGRVSLTTLRYASTIALAGSMIYGGFYVVKNKDSLMNKIQSIKIEFEEN